jgi:citrate lyase subunit beta/citryl-CoA lyase
MKPRRSVLFMPGSNARALEKAPTLPADALILDLEDAVAPASKAAARARVLDAVRAGGYGPREVIVRVNAPGTPWAAEDLAAVAHAPVDAVLLPKVESAETVTAALATLGPAPAVWCMLETPRGILNAASIAGAGPRVGALVGGHLDLDDDAGFSAACRQAADLGFDGKTLIHPRQVAAANEAFAPAAAEVEWARRVIAAHAEAAAAGRGVAVLDGRLVENLHVDDARRVLALAEAIAARTAG